MRCPASAVLLSRMCCGGMTTGMTATGAGPVMAAATRMGSLNQALHVVVLTGCAMTQRPAPTPPQRRRAQGKINREIKRCLVRYVARQLFRHWSAKQAAGSWFDHPISNRDHAQTASRPRRLAAVF
jgi:hypothetical protein